MQVETLSLTWKSTQLHALHWIPEKKPKAGICLIHGQSDHIGRFHHVAGFLVQEGYEVVGLDLIGHGLSPGKRGHVNQFTDYLEQVDSVVQFIRDVLQLPVILYGHSMGGLIALDFAWKSPSAIKACIATSPLLRLAFQPPAWRVSLGRFMLKVWPDLVQPAALDITAISRDTSVQEAYVGDKLVHGKITPAAFFGFIDAGNQLMDASNAIEIPTLVLHGTADRITDANASRQFAANNQSKVQFVAMDGYLHEMHNEPDQQQLFAVIADWLQQQPIQITL